jgi:hypothetical protein
MALKIEKRAVVNEHFLDLMSGTYAAWMRQEGRNAKAFPAGEKAYMERNRLRHARIHNLLHGGDGDGRSGKTYEITKLRGLPYTSFKAIQHEGMQYLVGETKPVVIDVGHNTRRIPERSYHLGAYRVYVPQSSVLFGNLDAIHMLPLKAPGTERRFMHHRAYQDEADHPLSYRTSTCWGDIGSTVKSYAADADIPELFRVLWLYLTRYNISSPLININGLGWDTETPWEVWHAN